ncbi:MAG: cytochrome c3 family protein [Pirellulaceae bacterium]
MTVSGKPTDSAERSEVCLQCHENDQGVRNVPCVKGWRTSAHAHKGVTCADCHRSHYNVPPGTPPAVIGAVDRRSTGHLAAVVQQPGLPVRESLRGTSHNLGAVAPDVCYRCHADMQRLEEIPHPHQLGIPFNISCTACHDPPPQGTPRAVDHHPTQFNCTTCHDAHGNVLSETRRDLCLKCHDGARMSEWHGSPHDAGGAACTDCHDPHPPDGAPMSVDQPGVCHRCHSQTRQLEGILHPHQVPGPDGMNCSTCHQAHGKVTPWTRKDVCLQCHEGTPTMAWRSSTHGREGVACADCHNPHPDTRVPRTVNVSSTTVKRPKRLPMSVDEPDACYQCHPKIYGLAALPSHHAINEGKIVCSDCHDGHGQGHRNLKADSVNELCYQCHAEKEGPFAYEHPPVTENCDYCHEPHGTVANNLLRQPTTFLCLRCHSGHSTHDQSNQCSRCHFVNGEITVVGGGPRDPMVPTTPSMRRALFTDCTQCHAQVHGSDLPYGMACFNRMFR